MFNYKQEFESAEVSNLIERLIGIILGNLFVCVIGYYGLLFLLMKLISDKAFRIFSLASFFIWAGFVLYLTVFIRVPVLEKRMNLIPFEGRIHEMMDNALLFLPWGSVVLGFKKSIKPFVCAFWGILTSLSIELLQLATGRGICDIDDLIANTVGIILGIFLFLLVSKLSRRR